MRRVFGTPHFIAGETGVLARIIEADWVITRGILLLLPTSAHYELLVIFGKTPTDTATQSSQEIASAPKVPRKAIETMITFKSVSL